MGKDTEPGGIAWERKDLRKTAEFYEAEAERPQSNPEYRRFCLDRAKRLREAAEPCPDESD